MRLLTNFRRMCLLKSRFGPETGCDTLRRHPPREVSRYEFVRVWGGPVMEAVLLTATRAAAQESKIISLSAWVWSMTGWDSSSTEWSTRALV